jgi:hypothetical protein
MPSGLTMRVARDTSAPGAVMGIDHTPDHHKTYYHIYDQLRVKGALSSSLLIRLAMIAKILIPSLTLILGSIAWASRVT